MFVNLIVSPPLVSLLVSYLVPHLVLIIYGYFPFITPCVFLCVVRLLWFFPLALTVSYYSPLVLSCQAPVLVAVFCVSLHPPLCVQLPWASTSTPAIPGYLRTRCGRFSLSLGIASSLTSFIASAAVTARPAVVIEPFAWQRILPFSDCPWKHSSLVYLLS